VVAVAAGAYHSLALKRDGKVVAWGWNLFGQTNVPSGLTGAVAVAAGSFHNLALNKEGTVVAWGRDDFGQATVPSGLTGVIGIAAGQNHSLALTPNSRVIAWGRDDSGQAMVPGNLTGLWAIAGGGSHSLALKLTAPHLGRPVMLTNGACQIRLTAEPGRNHILQASTNLSVWSAVSNLVPVNLRTEILDQGAAARPFRFYRVVAP
jgi:hypothetical protein